MDKKELYFDVERTSDDIITLIFNDPHETKLAFRAIKDLLGHSSGIHLRPKPTYAIILDRTKGGWSEWIYSVVPYVTEVNPTKRYYLTLIDGRISNNKVVYPLCIYKVQRAGEIPWN